MQGRVQGFNDQVRVRSNMNTMVFQFMMDDYTEEGEVARQISTTFVMNESATHTEVCANFLDFLKASGYMFSSNARLEVSQ